MCMMMIGTIASIGIGIAQAAAQQSAMNAEYEAQLRYRQEQAIQNQKTLNQQVAQQSAAYESEKGKAQGELADAAIQNAKNVGTVTAGIEERGVGGVSSSLLIDAVRADEKRFASRVQYNSQVAGYNAQNELFMAQRGAQARLAEIPIPTKPANTFALNALGAVASGIGTIASHGAKTGSIYS